MRDLSGWISEERWFGGGAGAHATRMEPRPFSGWACLGTFVEECRIGIFNLGVGCGTPENELMASIVRRLFPERIAGLDRTALDAIITFNDHPETTFADIQKVAREFDLERDLHA